MKIAVIGAGIAGLTAGNELAKAGHEVVIFEEKDNFGGSLATVYGGNNKGQVIDYGVPFFEPAPGEYGDFLDDLINKNLLVKWEGDFAKYSSDGSIYDTQPENPRYVAKDGMSSIGRYLARMLDVRLSTKVGGLTHIGAHRTKKRTWMLNFPTSETENFDAVIIATPARQAYAILNTTIDEIETLKLVREIDEIQYLPKFSFVASYGNIEKPEWSAMDCEDEIISWISNECTKREGEAGCSLVAHSTVEFAKKYQDKNPEKVAGKMAARLAEIIGSWAELPEWQQVYLWKSAKVQNPLPHDFMEIQNKETPLALIGGYMNGNDIESAYLSGLKLAKHWVEKYTENEKKD